MNVDPCVDNAQQQPAAAFAPPRVEVAGAQLWLFAELAPLLSAMLVDIRSAQHRIWLESYIFSDDSAGRAVANALIERSEASVDVRVIYDAIGSQATSAAFFGELAAAGVKVHVHQTIWDSLFRQRSWRLLNRRNHRKLLIVDEHAAYFGGMNLIDPVEALQASGAANLPTSAGWRDVHVRLVGSQAHDVAESFHRSWRREEHQLNRIPPRAYRRGLLSPEAESIRFFDSGPGFKQSRAARVYSRAMRVARREILLSMAYFIPAGRVLRALLAARRRRVRIRVVVPHDNDVKLVQYALRHLYSKLLKRGIEIYERVNCMLHSKAMVVDDQWSIVGSCNLDPRSLEINYEFLAVIRSPAFAAELKKICENEIQHSQRVTLDDVARRTRWQRWVDRLAYSLRAWL